MRNVAPSTAAMCPPSGLGLVQEGGCMSITVPALQPTPPASIGRIRGLHCRECGQLYPAEARHVCELCFGPLEVAYDYEVIRAAIAREKIERGPRTLWRYRDLLPIEGDRLVDTHAGFTP